MHYLLFIWNSNLTYHSVFYLLNVQELYPFPLRQLEEPQRDHSEIMPTLGTRTSARQAKKPRWWLFLEDFKNSLWKKRGPHRSDCKDRGFLIPAQQTVREWVTRKQGWRIGTGRGRGIVQRVAATSFGGLQENHHETNIWFSTYAKSKEYKDYLIIVSMNMHFLYSIRFLQSPIKEGLNAWSRIQTE